MDTSHEYIKMCEKAVELQGLWTDPQDGDFYSCPLTPNQLQAFPDNVVIFGCSFKETTFRAGEDGSVWLPRQDQLQEIYWGKFERPINALDVLAILTKIKEMAGNFKVNSLWSIEKAWLALCMDFKCNKYWTGEDWEPIVQKS